MLEFTIPKPEAEGTAAPGKGDKEPELDHKGMFDGFAKMRSYIDSIPTPGRDAGDTLGDVSLFAIAKDVLGGALTLMEAPTRPTRVEDIFQATVDMGPGMASVATKGPAGAIGMFGSRPSLGASREIHQQFEDMVLRAESLVEKGKDPKWRADRNVANGEGLFGDELDGEELYRDIWRETGLSKDHKGNWRYEISDGADTKVRWDKYHELEDWFREPTDVDAQVDKLIEYPDTPTFYLGDLLESPAVYEHWPDLKNVMVKGYTGGKGNGDLAHYNIATRTIHLNLDSLADADAPLDALRRALIHEAQHDLQHGQGRPSGTAGAWAKEQMEKAVEAVEKGMKRMRERDPDSWGDLTNEQSAVVERMYRIKKIWNEMKQFYGDNAAYYADPGEAEARLTEQSMGRPKITKMGRALVGNEHPDRRTGHTIIPPDRQFHAEDLNFPAPPPVDINDGRNNLGKTFGKRPDSQSHPMDDPNFDKLPKEVQDIITNEVPSVLNKSGSKVGDYPDNRNVHPQYYPMIVESFSRRANNFRRKAMQMIKEDGAEEWEAAISVRQAAKEAEETAQFYSQLIKEGAPKDPLDPMKELKKVGQVQRGEPEMAMLRVQERMGGGVLNPVIEHVGDITHRMVDLLEFDESQTGNVLSKVDRGLRALRHGYGFAREMTENIKNNAEARGVPVEQLQKEINESLQAYADAHRKVPVYNKALWHGREASVALGEQKWDIAELHLQKIKTMIENGSYQDIVRQYDPEFAKKKGAPEGTP